MSPLSLVAGAQIEDKIAHLALLLANARCWAEPGSKTIRELEEKLAAAELEKARQQ